MSGVPGQPSVPSECTAGSPRPRPGTGTAYDVEWAVPTHARQDRISRLTLRLLAERGVPKESVRLFVTPSLLDDYRQQVDPGLYAEMIPGSEGYGPQCNFIMRWYPEGTRVAQADDDLRDVRRRTDEKHTEPVEDLAELAGEGFDLCEQHRVGLWGVYPTLNPMFMRGHYRVGLWFCIGQLFGTTTTHDEWAQCVGPVKVDYERTLRSRERYGAVARLDYIACQSPLYGPGGMQAPDRPDRTKLNEEAVAGLLARWPQWVKRSARVGPRGPEVRLREPRA